jgi:hypothetical protein
LYFSPEKIKHADLREMSRMVTKSVNINCCGNSSPLASCCINFFTCEDFRDTEEDPDDPEPADEGNIQRYPLISFTAQV